MIHRLILLAAILAPSCASLASAQVENFPNLAGTPPKMLLLVQQEFKSGKDSERQKLEVAISRACDHVSVPNSWIDLESITGFPRALFFDPFDSFEHVDSAFAEWPQIFAAHPELARMQAELKALVSSERTIIAVRRDDLGFRPQTIDLSRPVSFGFWRFSFIPATRAILPRRLESSAAPTRKSKRTLPGSCTR